MQSIRVSTGWKRRAPVLAALVGGAIFLTWHLQVQPQGQAGAQTQVQPMPHMPVQSGDPQQGSEFYRIIKVGNYQLKIADAENIWYSKTSAEQRTNQRTNRLRAKEQAVAASGGKTPIVSTNYALGKGGKAIHPNMNLTLDIGGLSQEDAMLIQGVRDVHGKDDRSRELGSPIIPAPAERIVFPRPEPVDHRQMRIALQKEEDARSIKTLEGELGVINGIVRKVEFGADELHDNTSKRKGEVNATLNYIQPTTGGCEVSVTCVANQYEPRDPIGTQEHLEQFSLFGRAIEAEIIGSDGNSYKSYGGGGSTQRERPLTEGADGVLHRDGKVPSMSTVTSHLSFSFSSIPAGVRPQKVILRVVVQQGENFRVPFKFTDIPLADER